MTDTIQNSQLRGSLKRERGVGDGEIVLFFGLETEATFSYWPWHFLESLQEPDHVIVPVIGDGWKSEHLRSPYGGSGSMPANPSVRVAFAL